MFTELIIVNYKIKNAYNNYFTDLMDKYELSKIDLDIILFLYNNLQFNNAKDIVKYKGFAKSNVSTSLRDLENRGILLIKENIIDKRKTDLFLNYEYNDLFLELSNRQKEFVDLIHKNINSKDKQAFEKVIKQMIANISIERK